MPGPSKTVIKINALGRLCKEYELYKAEEVEYRAALAKLEQSPKKDEYEVRKATQILNETLKVKEQVWQHLQTQAADVRKLTNLKPEEETSANQKLAQVASLTH